ncbi:MAG: Mrp/NBP35 family ATP-binding protein [Chloroflexi bacterium]|nr:Mrp/NBP35 family ATP-binding protein [Chloroflexota bacterium]
MAKIDTLALARRALEEVMDPELDRSIVELGMVHDLAMEDGRLTFTLALTTMACPLQGRIQADARAAVLDVPGIHDVIINLREMTAEEKRAVFGAPAQAGGSAAGANRIRQVIAVVSGKGGVGKSSVAALLAVALRRKGRSVGILDADITGPSIPRMLLQGEPRPLGSPLGILPVLTEGGIKVMSINLLLADPHQAVIWRGPLIAGAIKQFWGDVVWGDLDTLIVDLPPGTSDASLTVMQSLPLNGIVLVTTPQGLAGMVVRKAASMAEQLHIPVLGLIENMSYLACPSCGEVTELFGPSQAAEVAASMGVPLLGRLPIDPEIARLGDEGRLEEYAAEEFAPVAERLLALVPEEAARPPLAN